MKLLVAIVLSVAITGGMTASAAETAAKEAAKPAEKTTATAAAKPAEKASTTKIEAPAKVEVKPVNPEKTIVTVNGKMIKEKDISPEIEKRINSQVARMSAQGWPVNDETKQMMRDQMRDQVVDMAVEKQLITEKIKAEKIDVKDAEVNARFAEMVKETGKTAEEVDAELAKMGMTSADIKDQIQWQLGVEKIYDASSEKKAVTEAETKKFYDDNKAQYFDKPEQVRASHILIKVDQAADDATKKAAKAKCEDLLKKVKAGGDFAALAKENSDCPSKDQGGDLGLFGRGQMVKPFEDAAFGMKVGEVSGIVETQFGYHIIKLTDKKAASTDSYDSVKDKIKDSLKSQDLSKFWAKTRQELKDKAKIEWSAEEKASREAKAKEQQQQMEIPQQPQPEEKK